MTSQPYRKGKELFTAEQKVWNQGQPGDIGVRPYLLDLNDAGPVAGAYTITGVTNVVDPVVTTGGNHGHAVGDRITMHGIGGSTGLNNTPAIPYWVVAATPAANTFQVDDPDGAAPAAPGAYTSGGFLMNLSKQFLSEVAGLAGAIISRGDLLIGKVSTNGVFDASDGLFPSVTSGADPAEAIVLAMARTLHGDAGDLADTAVRLIHYIHEGTGFPYSGAGNNVDLIFAAAGIFEI